MLFNVVVLPFKSNLTPVFPEAKDAAVVSVIPFITFIVWLFPTADRASFKVS